MSDGGGGPGSDEDTGSHGAALQYFRHVVHTMCRASSAIKSLRGNWGPDGPGPTPESCGEVPLETMLNGTHTRVYDTVGTYTGHFVNGRRYGYGVFEMKNFGRYEGEFRDNCMQGRGVLALPEGRAYVGEWHDCRQHGVGIYTWPDGRCHEGEYRSGLKHGQGVFKYEGEFQEDLRSGSGRYTWPSGEEYEGEFVDGEMHGQGYFISKDKDWSIEGHFANSRPTRGILSEASAEEAGAGGLGAGGSMLRSKRAEEPVDKLWQVQYDKKKCKPLPAVNKPSSKFQILDPSSAPNRRPLPRPVKQT